MYLVLIAWFYVTLMMALAEATSPTGSLLGAFVTFALYGLLPMGILGYILGTPGRKRKIHAREMAERAAAASCAQKAARTSAPTSKACGPMQGPSQASVSAARLCRWAAEGPSLATKFIASGA